MSAPVERPGETRPPRRLRQVSERAIGELAAVLRACVEGGASVSFMLPWSEEKAVAFWTRVARETEAGERVLLVAEDELGLCGTVQLVLNLPDNQPHRADLAKMLVHPRARRRGVAEALVRLAEAEARKEGRFLLVLDTVTGSAADRLYTRLGWVRVGEIPDYALYPQGGLCPTTYFYRDLRGPEACTPTESGNLLGHERRA